MVRLYRGVARDNPQYPEAAQEIIRPRGGPATPADHNEGDTKSEFTSWTTNLQVAREKATDQDLGGQGVVLWKDFQESELVISPDAFFEQEVLIRGLVVDALVSEVS